MGKYSLCIIDDKIPVEQFQKNIAVNNTGIIDQNVLFHYLSNEENWGESNLLALIKNIKAQADSPFILFGFKTHSFYLNYIDATLFSPDVIIFDWDVGDNNSEESLRSILGKTYCLIAVYTGADKNQEVSTILANDEFKRNEHRLFLLDKDTDDSCKVLMQKITELLKYFSFEHGSRLKKIYNSALNAVLSNIGNISFDQFVCLFGEKTTTGFEISEIDFIEIINEKIKSRIFASKNSQDIKALKTKHTEQNSEIETIKKLWNFRMYHNPNDDRVRRGDIIWHKTENLYYLIITSDCHLSEFWKKNLGFLAAVPLYKSDDIAMVKRIQDFSLKAVDSFSVSSIVNANGINITILPVVDGKDDYILSPKKVCSFDVPLPNGVQPSKHLTYSDIDFFDSTKRYRLNEPFLSALIEFILRNYADIGAPDYPKTLQNELKKYFEVSCGVKNGK